jgi:hypothetical protein
MLLRRFPVTFILGLQYLLLVVIPGLSNGTARFETWLLLGLGLLAAVAAEALLPQVQVPAKPPAPQFSLRAIRLVTRIGVAATVLVSVAGTRSYAAQIGTQVSTSPLGKLATPFVPWVVIGLTLALLAFAAGTITRAQLVRLALESLPAVFLAALYSGILISAVVTVFPLIILSMLFGIARMRVVVAFLLLFVLVWPTIHSLRNEQRIKAGALVAELEGSAAERFNLDSQVWLLDKYGRQPIDAPSIPTMFRYGLLPAVIDSGRPPLLIGQELNRRYGGSGESSQSLTVLGNVYVISDWPGMMAYVALLALGLRLLLHRSAVALLFAVLLIQSFLFIDASYPVSIAGFLQSVVSFGAAVVVLHLVTRLDRRLVWGYPAATPVSEEPPDTSFPSIWGSPGSGGG